MKINLLSDYGREYSVQLREFTEFWMPYAADAYAIVWGSSGHKPMTPIQFVEFKKGLKIESTGKYAGDKWAESYSAIVMPEIIFYASMIAVQFNVPWGLAFIRLEQEGMIREKDGMYVRVVPGRNDPKLGLDKPSQK